MANDFSGNADLVALYNFDVAPGLLLDSSGNNETLSNSASPVTQSADAKQGDRSADFSGSGQQLSRADGLLGAGFPYKNGTANKKSLSTFWVKFDSFDATVKVIISKYAGAGDLRTFAILVAATTDKLIVRIGHTGGTAFEDSNPFDTAFAAGIWYHCGAWHDDSDKSYGMRIWDDNAGALLDSNKTGTFTNNISLRAAPFYLGGFSLVGGGNGDLDGHEEEDAIFNDYPGTQGGINTMIDEIRQEIYGAGGNAPTGTLYGPLVGPLGGPI